MPDQEGDLQVLEAMKAAGSDLSKPAHIIHYLYFKSMSSAESAATELRSSGFEKLNVHPSPGDSFWKRLLGKREFSCIAETHAVPSEANVFESTRQMNDLAAKHGGEYDGWEASIEH